MIRSLSTSVFVLSLALAACSGSTSQTETSTASAAQSGMTTSPVAPQVTGHLRVVADALSTVPLRADQRTQIEQMATDATTRHAAVQAAHAQLAEAIAAQIETGTLDRAALQPKIDAATAAVTASRPADQAAFTQLHALLTPDQRSQFVDAIESHGKAKPHEHGMHAKMEEWATDLKLTDDQQSQIKSVLQAQFASHLHDMGAMHAMHAHGKDFLESFKGDTLADAPAAADIQDKATKMTDGFFAVAAKILPVLTPEQRSLAAAKIRAHALGGPDAPGE